MFELCENQQFLTRKDLMLARLCAEDFDPEQKARYYVDYERTTYLPYGQTGINRIRENTKFIGYMCEAAHPWSKLGEYRQKGHIGYKIDEDTHILATYTFEQNHILDDSRDPTDTVAKYFYVGWRGANGIAFHYCMSERDRKWWLGGTKVFREHPQVKIDFFPT